MDFSRLMLEHRSIRRYKPDPIDDSLIQEVLSEAISGGSSSGNLNSVSMVLTRDLERRRELFKLHSEQDMILQAPLVVTFCADWSRTRRWLKLRGARDNFNNLLGYHVGAYDAMLVAQNVSLGFQARGLGICYMGTTLFSLKQISDLLELPETCVPVTTIVVGYPDENPGKRDRLPLKGLVFDEKYNFPSDDELLDVYADREVKGWARYMSIPELKAMAEDRGITSLAQFYTSKLKYDPDYFAECSAQIEEFLKEKGFLK